MIEKRSTAATEALNEFLRRYARKSHERGGAKTSFD